MLLAITRALLGISLSLVAVIECSIKDPDTYDEELSIKRLNTEQILSQFRFVVTSDTSLGPDYDLFPRIIAEVTNKYDIDEFHFSLAQGFWRNAEWGLSPQPASPSGAQLYAWFRGNESSVDERWNHFVNSLNGIFCTSLLEMVAMLSTSPRHLSRSGRFSAGSEAAFLRYGALAGETVCTENLTPWKKLLPCKETGLSMLLNPEKLYSSYFHSMSIHLTRTCQGSSTPCMERSRLELNLNAVSDLNLQSRSIDWSIYGIFEKKIDEKCKVARSSRVIFERDRPSVTIDSPSKKLKFAERVFYIYDIGELEPHAFPFNLRGHYKSKLDLSKRKPSSSLSVHSFLGGTDQQCGRVTTRIGNLQSVSQEALYLHVIPWFVQVYFHTINLRCISATGDGKGAEVFGRAELLNFVGAKNRQRPFLLEYRLHLPSSSVCDFSFDFDKAFLRVTDFPPDASHGMYVPSPVLTFAAEQELWNDNRTVLGDSHTSTYEELSGNDASSAVSIFGEVLLVSLPVPDFSMPFNVICFVSTAIAILFGPVHSLTTKILIPVSEKDKDLVPKPLLRSLLAKIVEFVKKLLRKVKKKKVDKDTDSKSHEESPDDQTNGQPWEKQQEIHASEGIDEKNRQGKPSFDEEDSSGCTFPSSASGAALKKRSGKAS